LRKNEQERGALHLVLRSQKGTLNKRVGLARASELLALFVCPLEQFALKAGTEMFDWFKRGREQRLFRPFLYTYHDDILPSFLFFWMPIYRALPIYSSPQGIGTF
jgi:hypothetical protein